MERREFLVGAGAAAAAWGLSWPQGALAQTSGDAAFNTLLDRIFAEQVVASPEFATSLGLDKGANAGLKSRLDDRSAAKRLSSQVNNRAALARIRAFDGAALSEAGRRNRDIVIYKFEQDMVADPFGLDSVQRPYLISQQGGAYFEVPDFLDSQHVIETVDDAEAYLSRLHAFGFVLDDQSELQRAEAARGVVAPGWSIDLALAQMRKLRQPAPEANAMVESLVRRASAKGLAGDWRSRAAAIVAQGVYPALDRQIALMQRLRRTTPAGDGAWRLRRGADIYAAALRQGTTTDLSPEQVHKIGLDQVAELSGRLDTILRKAGHTTGTVGARLAVLNTSPEQLYPDSDEGRAAMLASLNAGIAAMKTRLPRAFSNIPDEPLEIRRVPPEIQDGAPNGYYYSAPIDKSRPAIYWINLKSVADWPKYGLPSLTYHEGIPGHHLQNGYSHQGPGLPLMLKQYFISAYGEGWALYAEQLADELGGYSEIEQAGYLQSFLFRAVRLVVDTGIHHYRWSRERATAYMVDHAGFAQPRSQREIERYCTMMGQACSYKIGHTMWVKVRDRAQAALGDKFTLPWFHEVLTEGAMPLSMLEKRVDERIAERLRAG
jgi:uncharacterized protein (DUF885 family)